MPRILEKSGGHIVIRNATGEEVLNTAKPMPVRRGLALYSGIALSWGEPPGTTAELGSGGIRRKWPRTAQHVADVVLGAYSGGARLPDYISATASFTRTSGQQGEYGTSGKGLYSVLSEYTFGSEPIIWGGGSLIAEILYDDNDPLWGIRHLNLVVKNGNWVVEMRHSNEAFTPPFSSVAYSLASTYTMNIDIEWGLFK